MGILKEKHFSIEFLNEDGFDIISELTGLEMDKNYFDIAQKRIMETKTKGCA